MVELQQFANEALGGDTILLSSRSSYIEAYGHEDETSYKIDTEEAIKCQKTFDFLRDSIDEHKEYLDPTNNIEGRNWFVKINTDHGNIAYIIDNYPSIYMLKTDFNKLQS